MSQFMRHKNKNPDKMYSRENRNRTKQIQGDPGVLDSWNTAAIWSDSIRKQFDINKNILGEGGMGKVFLLTSKTSGRRFAVKRVIELNASSRREFLRELNLWIGLPKHPNLVPCRFFRTMGNETLIFADYMEEGSLAQWIDTRKLYASGEKEILARILDVAIQVAWGLHCVHQLGLVHQDVKPGNVLLAMDAQAAVQGLRAGVADYGIARTRENWGTRCVSGTSPETLVSSRCGSRAYQSPEQADPSCKKVDWKTDLWSFGVSVLEMFQGRITWRCGSEAAAALEAFLKHNDGAVGIPAMPQGVAEVLRGCFRENNAQLLENMEAVVNKLKDVYRDEVATEYGRPLTHIAYQYSPQLRARDRLTREGTFWTDPQMLLEWALREDGRDPAEAAKMAARHGGLRRGKLVADIAVYEEARFVFERLVKKRGTKDLTANLAILCMEAAGVHATADDWPGALALYDQAIAVFERMLTVEGFDELTNDLARAYMLKAIALASSGDTRSALKTYDLSIEECERLKNNKPNAALLETLALACMNKGNALWELDDTRSASDHYDRAIAIWEQMVNDDGRDDLSGQLAAGYQNKTTVVKRLEDRLVLYDKAIAILERLVNIKHQVELSTELAMVYQNKALALHGLGDNPSAIFLYNKAINIWERLVNLYGWDELANDLAGVYTNKANAIADGGEYLPAIELYDKAIKLREQLVNDEGRDELAIELAHAYGSKATAVGELKDYLPAADLHAKAVEIYERLVHVEGHSELATDLAMCYQNMAAVIFASGDRQRAVALYDIAIKISERLFNAGVSDHSSNLLAVLYQNKAVALGCMHKKQSALDMFDKAMEIREQLINNHGHNDLVGDLAVLRVLRGRCLIQNRDIKHGTQQIKSAIPILRAEVSRTGRAQLRGLLKDAQRLVFWGSILRILQVLLILFTVGLVGLLVF